jgi:hypothetical protein
MNNEERVGIRQAFREAVNMAPAELAEWLQTEESRSVGDVPGRALGEMALHVADDGAHVVVIVVGEIPDVAALQLHDAPTGGVAFRLPTARAVADTRWRYSLMN